MANSATPASIVQAAAKTVGTTATTAAATATTVTMPTATVVDSTPLILTKFQFRKLFTTSERIVIDNIATNPNFSSAVKGAVVTLLKDLEVSGEVDLHLADVIAGVNFLQQIGILTPVRMARVLANLPPL